MKNEKVVEKALRTLSKNFNPIVVVIKEANYSSYISIDELMGSLLSHKSRININNNS